MQKTAKWLESHEARKCIDEFIDAEVALGHAMSMSTQAQHKLDVAEGNLVRTKNYLVGKCPEEEFLELVEALDTHPRRRPV